MASIIRAINVFRNVAEFIRWLYSAATRKEEPTIEPPPAVSSPRAPTLLQRGGYYGHQHGLAASAWRVHSLECDNAVARISKWKKFMQ